MTEIFDDRPINPAQLPHDSAEMVEVAAGIYVPANRKDLFWDIADRSASIRQTVDEIESALTEVAPGIQVERRNVAAWHKRMENEPVFRSAMDHLMDIMNIPELAEASIVLTLTQEARFVLAQERVRHSVSSTLLGYA